MDDQTGERQDSSHNCSDRTGDSTLNDHPTTVLADAVTRFEQAYTAAAQYETTRQRRQFVVALCMCLLSFLTFVAAAIYAAITYYTLIAINESNALSRSSFEASQRAYMAAGAIEAHLEDVIPWIKIPIRNYGHIPTHYVLLEGALFKERQWSNNPIPMPVKTGGDYAEYPPSCASSREEQTGFDLDLSGFLSKEDVDLINKAQERLSISATITYRTGFRDQTDEFAFCASYNPGSPEPLMKWDACGMFTPEFSRQLWDAVRNGRPIPHPPSHWPSPHQPMPKTNQALVPKRLKVQ